MLLNTNVSAIILNQVERLLLVLVIIVNVVVKKPGAVMS